MTVANAMARTLTVWLGEFPIADLSTAGREMELRYRPEAVTRHGIGSIALSTALTVVPDPYKGTPVRWWAESLLPEGETRTALENRFDVQRGDAFALLEAIGADCAGAVSFLPPGVEPVNDLGSATDMSSRDFADAIEALPRVPLGVSDDVRVSLGGLQAKLLLTRTPQERWARPAAGTPSTHLAKPDPRDLPGLVVAEAFTLALAQEAGIRASEFDLEEVGGRPVLILKRFDRRVEGERVLRIHQEDGSAALGLDPTGRHKYQSLEKNTPTLAGLAQILARNGTNRREDLLRLGEAVILRMAVGDTDGHARNYAFLHHGETLDLAPVYDAAPTSQFASAREVGLWLGGQSYFAYLKGHHLVDELARWRVPIPVARDHVVAVLDRLDAALSSAHARVPQFESPAVEKIRGRIAMFVGTL